MRRFAQVWAWKYKSTAFPLNLLGCEHTLTHAHYTSGAKFHLVGSPGNCRNDSGNPAESLEIIVYYKDDDEIRFQRVDIVLGTDADVEQMCLEYGGGNIPREGDCHFENSVKHYIGTAGLRYVRTGVCHQIVNKTLSSLAHAFLRLNGTYEKVPLRWIEICGLYSLSFPVYGVRGHRVFRPSDLPPPHDTTRTLSRQAMFGL